ncbi:MAG: substrate-binding domain-containing protein [Clostridiales bacterium]|jgi:ribose transport system substrate-binding protein|nr:substrate-binding domain-containing protein [Clostridiales bacterium]OPZ67307.1 MAG: D-allose-binding periplasmic protein precursor [Firmicutes bacterium ADurb.Bin467]
MKKVLVLALAVMLLLSAAVPAMATAKPLEGGFIPVIPLGVAHQFWQAVKMGAEQAAEEYGVTIVFDGPQEETMVDKQVDILRANLTNENLIAVCMAAIDEQSVLTDLTAVKEKGMPVVGFDAGCGAIADAHCSTSNYAAGELAAQNAIRLLNGEGKIAIVGHSQTVVDAVARVKGFVDYIQANSKIEIVDTQYGDGDHLKSADIAKSMLIANPDIDLIYASNEGACVGAYNGLKEINMIGKVMLIGFDSSAAMKAGVRNGEIAGAITQDPVGMGYKAVATACKLVLGEPVEGEVNENGTIVVDTGCYWYDATNMDEAHIAPLLYD